MLSAVAISNVTPLAPAGDDKLTVYVNAVVPVFPSNADTSLTARLLPPVPVVVNEKSSIESPSSAPAASKLDQRK